MLPLCFETITMNAEQYSIEDRPKWAVFCTRYDQKKELKCWELFLDFPNCPTVEEAIETFIYRYGPRLANPTYESYCAFFGLNPDDPYHYIIFHHEGRKIREAKQFLTPKQWLYIVENNPFRERTAP